MDNYATTNFVCNYLNYNKYELYLQNYLHLKKKKIIKKNVHY